MSMDVSNHSDGDKFSDDKTHALENSLCSLDCKLDQMLMLLRSTLALHSSGIKDAEWDSPPGLDQTSTFHGFCATNNTSANANPNAAPNITADASVGTDAPTVAVFLLDDITHANSDPNTDTNSTSDTNPNADAMADANTKTNTNTNKATADASTNANASVNLTDANAEANADPNTHADANNDSNPDTAFDAAASANADPNARADVNVGTDANIATVTRIDDAYTSDTDSDHNNNISITTGTVLILRHGRFRGRRVVCLKKLDGDRLLVADPSNVNGVPRRRVHQHHCTATKQQVSFAKG